MKAVSVKDAKDLLRQLPAEDLKEVLDFAAARVDTSDKLNSRQKVQAAELYQSLEQAYRDVYRVPCKPFNAWRNQGGTLKELIRVRQEFDLIVDSAGIQERNRKLQAYRFLWSLVVERVRRANVVVSPSTMIRFGAGIVGLFDRHFPGYLQSGLSKVVFSQHARPLLRVV